MRTYFNVFKAIGGLFGVGGEGGGGGSVTKIFQAPTVDDSAARERQAAEEAKRKSALDQQGRVGAASSLMTSPDLGNDFGKIGGKKTLLGGA